MSESKIIWKLYPKNILFERYNLRWPITATAITRRNTIKNEIFIIKKKFCSHIKKVCFQLKKVCLQWKKCAHTEKRFVYFHKTNPRQIAAANSHGKQLRQIPMVKSHGKFSRHISRANNHYKYMRKSANTFNTPHNKKFHV